MNKNKKSVNEMIQERSNLLAKREALDIKMNEIADKAAAEKRDMSAEENVEYQNLQSQFSKCSREIAMYTDSINIEGSKKPVAKSQNQMMREYILGIKDGNARDVVLQREAPLKSTDIEAGGMVPLTIKDIIPPTEMGLIYDKVGIEVQTGVEGDIQWPVCGSVEAEIKGETLDLTDKTIDLSKIQAQRTRIGISISVDNQAINNANTDLVSLIKNQIQMGLKRTINRACFSYEDFTGTFHGPYAGAKVKGTFAGKIPTYKELLEMKGSVAGAGVEMLGFCYIMSEAMKATLEATPIDAGSGRMVVENGTVAGYPIFCTNYVNYGSASSKDAVEHVLAGCFGYLALNQHGDARLVIDPYSQAKKDVVVITLNGDWSLTTLRKEAFTAYACHA